MKQTDIKKIKIGTILYKVTQTYDNEYNIYKFVIREKEITGFTVHETKTTKTINWYYYKKDNNGNTNFYFDELNYTLKEDNTQYFLNKKEAEKQAKKYQNKGLAKNKKALKSSIKKFTKNLDKLLKYEQSIQLEEIT